MKKKYIYIIIITIFIILVSFKSVYANHDIFIEVSDKEGGWQYIEEIDLFETQYTDEKIIYPGSWNNYTFHIKNISEYAIECSLDIKVNIIPHDITIPVISQIKNEQTTLNNNQYLPITKLNNIKDKKRLEKGKSTDYTIEWLWPFDENNQYDTYLGDKAIEEDIEVKVQFVITAKTSDAVNTSDNHSMLIYIFLLSVSVLVIHLIKKRQ